MARRHVSYLFIALLSVASVAAATAIQPLPPFSPLPPFTTAQAQSANSQSQNGQGQYGQSGKESQSVTYQINPAHSGQLADPSLVPPLDKLWALPLEGDVSYPLVVSNTVFVTLVHLEEVGTTEDVPVYTKLYALDASTGNSVWGPVIISDSHPQDASSYHVARIAYDRGRVFVVDSSTGDVQAYDAQTGERVWVTHLDVYFVYHSASAPTAINGILYINASGMAGQLFALRETDGTLLWVADASVGDQSSPAVGSVSSAGSGGGGGGTGVFISGSCQQTYRFDPLTGQQVWHHHLDCVGGGGRTPVLYNGKLYLRDLIQYPHPPFGPYILDAQTGQPVEGYAGATEQDGPPAPAAAFDGGMGFFPSDTALRAVDLTTNQIVWTFNGDGAMRSAPIVVNGTVYVGSANGVVYGVRARDGTQVFTGTLPAGVIRPEENSDRTLVGLGAGGGKLFVPASDWLVAFGSHSAAPPPPGASPAPSQSPSPGQTQPGGPCRTFAETGKAVCGKFLQYWLLHGGLAQQGFPISDQLSEVSEADGKPYTVQYFERAVFEYHPENPVPNDVLLSLLGSFLYKQKYPQGAPGQVPSAEPGGVKFDVTGHTVGGRFLDYWRTHGGLAQQGYPISEEFSEKSDLDGNTYRVQYFERAVFEYHPENQPPSDVLLSQLGTFRYRGDYLSGGGPVRRPASQPVPDANWQVAQVTRVIDGDTIEVMLNGNGQSNGQRKTVRYVLVNTPETVDPRKPVECYGKEASNANKAMVEGKTVYLEKDVSETDRYGRLLRYVFTQDGLVNAELVKGGYAQVATYPPDVKYEQYLRELEQEVRAAGRGLWGPACKQVITKPGA